MLYDYEACLLLIRAMIQRAEKDIKEDHIGDAYLFLWWCRVYLVGYLEDLGGE